MGPRYARHITILSGLLLVTSLAAAPAFADGPKHGNAPSTAAQPKALPPQARQATPLQQLKPMPAKPAQPAQTKPAPAQPTAQPAQTKPARDKPTAQPAQSKPARDKPTAQPAQTKPGRDKPTARPAQSKPTSPRETPVRSQAATTSTPGADPAVESAEVVPPQSVEGAITADDHPQATTPPVVAAVATPVARPAITARTADLPPTPEPTVEAEVIDVSNDPNARSSRTRVPTSTPRAAEQPIDPATQAEPSQPPNTASQPPVSVGSMLTQSFEPLLVGGRIGLVATGLAGFGALALHLVRRRR